MSPKPTRAIRSAHEHRLLDVYLDETMRTDAVRDRLEALGRRRATLKVELVHDATWATRTAARTELFDYLEVFYNGQRRHSALGYLSPRAFERRREQEAVAT